MHSQRGPIKINCEELTLSGGTGKIVLYTVKIRPNNDERLMSVEKEDGFGAHVHKKKNLL